MSNFLNVPAILVLADGSVFHGQSIGVTGSAVGEVVFNTALTGYQEILTDPSYCQQIVTLTYPHIGNVGVNSEDQESLSVHSAGLVIRDLPLIASNFRSEMSLQDYLTRHNVVAISEIDTRRLTRLLRDKGAQNGCILAGENPNVETALSLAQTFSGLKGKDLAQTVSCQAPYHWSTTEWALGEGYGKQESPQYKVVALDFGVKHNILRMLAQRGCDVHVVPAKTTVEEILAMNPDGVFLSNGPGDPEPCDYAIATIRALLEIKMPLFGICLGHQLLGLAAGAATIKMKFGHHGANHPVQDVQSGQVMITSQNHGFAVDEASLPDNVLATHRSLFDGTLQGITFTDRPAFSFQGHPEASPGPHDVAPLFDRFVADMAAVQ